MKQHIQTLLLFAVVITTPAMAQVQFDSGSTGADGPLTFYAPPPARSNHLFAYHASAGHAVLYGGFGVAGDEIGDTWLFDGTSWTQAQPTRTPAPRNDPAWAYDSNRNVVVMYGGYLDSTAAETSETWEWDGTDWTQVKTDTQPPALQGAAMAYDSVNQKIVLFGGDNGTVSDAFYTYDGTNWTSENDINPPPARAYHRMAYDVSDGQIVMYGGSTTTSYSNSLDDTWTLSFNGIAYEWQQVSVDLPTGGLQETEQRFRFGMTYDANRQTVVLFGGYQNSFQTRDNELYEFDGSQWSRIVPGDTQPAGRSNGQIVYDPSSKDLYLFGGSTTDENNETWIFDDESSEWTQPNKLKSNPVISLSSPEVGQAPIRTFNYSSVTIPEGVTVSFERNSINSPVQWLVSGDVLIDGTIDVSGQTGTTGTAPGSEAAPGPGGFSSGLSGGASGTGTPGLGPGGGLPATNAGDGAFAVGGNTPDGAIYGNPELVPIVGGSGGAGATNGVGGGGGGGGAILIASSGTITVNGIVNADGGIHDSPGGYGAGGAIKLVANEIAGSGSLRARGGASSSNYDGRIRLEAFRNGYSGGADPVASTNAPETLDMAAFLAAQPSVTIASIAGQAVPADGSFNLPEAAFSDGTAVDVVFATENIPAGVRLNIRITTFGNDRATVILLTGSNGPQVQGDGSATLNRVLPSGLGTIQAWTNFFNQ